MSGHNFAGHLFNWRYCVKCGLITLKNKATRKAMDKRCPGDDDQ